MTITRIFSGVSIQVALTAEELQEAYFEQEHLWDISYVNDNVEIFMGEDKFNALTDADISSIAHEMRRVADKYSMSDWAALEEACENFVQGKCIG